MTALTNLEGRRDLAVLGWHGMCRLYREQRVLILRTAMGCSQAQPRLTANSSVSAAAHAINAGAGVMFHIEFQSSPDAHMAARLLEYVALLPWALRRSGWTAADGGRIVTHVPLVVYNGRAKWNAPLRLAEPIGCRRYCATCTLGLPADRREELCGDDAADGNPARAVLVLDAASGQGLAPALGAGRGAVLGS